MLETSCDNELFHYDKGLISSVQTYVEPVGGQKKLISRQLGQLFVFANPAVL